MTCEGRANGRSRIASNDERTEDSTSDQAR